MRPVRTIILLMSAWQISSCTLITQYSIFLYSEDMTPLTDAMVVAFKTERKMRKWSPETDEFPKPTMSNDSGLVVIQNMGLGLMDYYAVFHDSTWHKIEHSTYFMDTIIVPN